MRLGDIGRIITGKTPSTKNQEYFGGEIPFITPKDIQSGKFITSSERTLSEAGVAVLPNHVLPKNSICVSCIGNLGYIAKTIEKRSITNQQINSIIVSEEHDADYVYYLIKNMWGYFKTLEGNSTALSILNKSQFSEIEVELPDLETQRTISATLSALDDKIAVNNKVNKVLEEMAQTIFKSWFLDFGPWGGVMPQDWETCPLGEIASIKHGYAFKGKHFCDEPTEHHVLTPGNFCIGGGFQTKPKYYNGEIRTDYVLEEGDLVVTMTDLSRSGDTLGFSALIPKSNFYLHNQRIGLVNVNELKAVKSYVYWLMRTPKYQKYIVNHASGSTVKHTSPKSILSFEINLPPISVQQDVSTLLSSIESTVITNANENETLIGLRDSLLPKLISGEIKV